MKQNKFLSAHAFHLASALAILALFLFLLAGLSPQQGMRIFLGILSALSLIVGLALIFISSKAKGDRYHYFLYDPRRGRSIKPDDLTAQHIVEGTHRYLSEYVRDPKELFADFPKPLRIQLQQDNSFRPLVAYLMLHSLSGLDSPELMAYFTASSPRAIGYLCQSLSIAGDGEMADYIFSLKQHPEKAGRICAFFHKNRRRFEGRMLHYVEENMSDFYRNKPLKKTRQ